MTNTLTVRSSVAVGYFLLQGVFPRGTREESNYFFIPSLSGDNSNYAHFFPEILACSQGTSRTGSYAYVGVCSQGIVYTRATEHQAFLFKFVYKLVTDCRQEFINSCCGKELGILLCFITELE